MHIDDIRAATPEWYRTGFRKFPYSALHDDAWWVLRVNHGFPEHDLLTLFVGGATVVDVPPAAVPPRSTRSSLGCNRSAAAVSPCWSSP